MEAQERRRKEVKERGNSKRQKEENKRNERGIVMGIKLLKDERKTNNGIKTLPALSFMRHAAVTVRESDKCHFHERSAVSEDQDAVCSDLMHLRRTTRKCDRKMSFTSSKQT